MIPTTPKCPVFFLVGREGSTKWWLKTSICFWHHRDRHHGDRHHRDWHHGDRHHGDRHHGDRHNGDRRHGDWREGYRILIMEFSPKRKNGAPNICVPIGSDGKFRVWECTMVGEKDLKELGLVKEKKLTSLQT